MRGIWGIQRGLIKRRLVWGHVVVVLATLAAPLGGAAAAVHAAPVASERAAWSGVVPVARGIVSPLGVGGTTAADLAEFAAEFSKVRQAHGLRAIPLSQFRYDPCMEQRLFWIAEDPSTDMASAWGHIGTKRSDGVPSVGCDGNLAGGRNNTGKVVADKWWASVPHRTSLYRPGYTGSLAGVCIYFAMTHGGVPNESASFIRAAARWGAC